MINQRMPTVHQQTYHQLDAKQGTKNQNQNLILTWLANMTSVSEILRVLGAGAVIASMSVFLLNGWSEGNDVVRYLKLLTQTALLTAAGFAMSYLLKENKGARLFFGLGLISVAANFTILGALIYSIIQLDGNLLQYPDFVTWKVVDPSQFGLVAAAAFGFLVLVTKLSYSIFARHSSTALTLGFLLLGGSLLIPVRSSLLISGLILVTALFAIYLIHHLYQRDQRLATLEGKFALATLLIPSLIMTIRALSLYDIDTIMSLSLAGISFIGLRQFLPQLKDSYLKNAMELIKAGLGLFIAFSLADLFPSVYQDYAQIVFAFSLMLLSNDSVEHSNSHIVKRMIINGTVLVLALMFSGEALWHYDLTETASAIGVGMAMIILAKAHGAKVAMILGALTVVAGLVMTIMALIDIVELSSWITLGVCGILVIISASIIERHGVSLKLKMQDWTKK